jgi:hypothetical protein
VEALVQREHHRATTLVEFLHPPCPDPEEAGVVLDHVRDCDDRDGCDSPADASLDRDPDERR